MTTPLTTSPLVRMMTAPWRVWPFLSIDVGRKERDNDGHDPLQGSRRALARSLTPTVTQRELLAAISA